MTVSKTVDANSTVSLIQLERFAGAVCGQAYVTCSTAGFSVAKVYSFARQYDNSAVITIHSDTGTFQNNDFDLVNITHSGWHFIFGVFNYCSFSANITATFMIGGHTENLQVTTL